MKLSMWTSYLINMTPEDAIRTFAEHQWPSVELSTEHSESLLQRGDAEAAGKAFVQHATDLGVQIKQGHLKLHSDIVGDGPKGLDELKQWLDLYLTIGINRAVLHPSGVRLFRDGATVEELRDAQADAIAVLTKHVASTDLVICLENTGVSQQVEHLLALVNAVGGDNLAICLDTGHLNMHDGNQGEFIRAAGHHLKALHIADNDGSGDQHLLPFGRGRVDWANVMSALDEIGYTGHFNFEVPGENRCPENILMEKLDYAHRVGSMMIDGSAFG